MGAHLLDVEFSKYWAQLTPVQKQSLLGVIKTFFGQERISISQYNQELKEAEAEYKAGNYISQDEMLELVKKW